MKNRLLLAIILSFAFLGQPPAQAQELEPPALFHEAMRQVRNGKYRQAMAASEALRNDPAPNPFPSLLAVQVNWEMIYCETGHINSKEIWNEADIKTSRYDNGFLQAVDQTLELSRELQAKAETAAQGALYAGLARGARARLYAIRKQNMQSASESKKMRTDLLEAVSKDPQLEADAALGLGAYNYYADVLSPILKFLRFFLRIPGGNREKGLQQLHIAAAKSSLWREDAMFELGRIYGVREKRHSRAFALFQQLARQYPDNPIYALSAAFQAEADGQRTTAIEYVQRAKDAAATIEADCGPRLMQAAQGALQRLQADPK
ncbi:MAG: hypothetical protein HYX72_12680 [Acidobacteria bacterium]|nr:hypothetical protein [Acidobacteriota bacterium]